MAIFTIASSAKHPKGVTILLYQQALVRGHLWQSWEVTADLAGGIGVQGSQAAAQPADPLAAIGSALAQAAFGGGLSQPAAANVASLQQNSAPNQHFG